MIHRIKDCECGAVHIKEDCSTVKNLPSGDCLMEGILYKGGKYPYAHKGLYGVYRDGKHIASFYCNKENKKSLPALPLKKMGEQMHVGWDIPTRWAIDADDRVWEDNAHGGGMNLIDQKSQGAEYRLAVELHGAERKCEECGSVPSQFSRLRRFDALAKDLVSDLTRPEAGVLPPWKADLLRRIKECMEV